MYLVNKAVARGWAQGAAYVPILVTNFQKSPSAGGFPPPAPLIFNIGKLKLRDLAK